MSDTSNCFLRLPISVDLCGIEERLDRIESRIDGLRQSLFSKIDRETNELAATLQEIIAAIPGHDTPAQIAALTQIHARLTAMGKSDVSVDPKP